MPEISIKAEPIATFFGFHFTNSLLLSLIGLAIIAVLGFAYKMDMSSSKRGGLFFVIHITMRSIYNLFKSVLHEKTDYFFPLLGGFFIWIMLQNWIGLLPGVGSILVGVKENGHTLEVPLLRGNNADINATLALAIISVLMIQVYGIKFLGLKAYLQKFINFSNPINFFVGILEIVSEFSKVISFAFRLFGNIFAGEVLMTIIAFLVPVIAPFPFLLLELFVGFIQALVFAMLTTVFLSIAITKHH